MVALVLLFGLVVASLGVTLYLGTLAFEDVRGTIGVQNAEYSMREIDSRLSRVAFSDNDVETLDLETVDGTVHVLDESYMNITVNETAACRVQIPMGSIVQETDDGTETAYEGGGVWRRQGNGSVMVSPPDFQYRDGTVNFPVVSVGGSIEGGDDDLRAEKNLTASQKRSREITQTLTKPACNPPGNLTIDVHSEYYQAWGRYFGEVTGENVTYNHDEQRATVPLTAIGGPAAVSLSGGSVSAENDYIAEVNVSGTGYHTSGWHLPIGMKVSIEGEGVKTFSPHDGIVDRPINMSYGHDDMNNPLVGYEHANYPTDSVTVPGGKNFSVLAISYVCDDSGGSPTSYPDADELEDTGPTMYVDPGDPTSGYRSENMNDRCVAENLGDRPYRNISSLSGSPYLYVFNHTVNSLDQKPYVTESDFESVAYGQRPPQDVYPDLYDDVNNEFDLAPNQAIFIYDLNQPLGSADFNDVLVLVTFREQGTLGPGGQFSIRISMKSVSISGS